MNKESSNTTIFFYRGIITGFILHRLLTNGLSTTIVYLCLFAICCFIVGYFMDNTVNKKLQTKKKENAKIVDDINTEIIRLRERIPILLNDDNGGSKSLAGIYINRVVMLEKMKQQYELGIILKRKNYLRL